MFGGSTATKEAEAYRKAGRPKRIRTILNYLETRGIQGASIVDIGFGIGSTHLELLKLGAGQVIGFEIVEPYIRQAEKLAVESGFVTRVDYRLGDFTCDHSDIVSADIVILDRSVCCYPDMRGLVQPSADIAGRFYVLILPVENLVSRLVVCIANLVMWLRRTDFRVFIHPQTHIDRVLQKSGLHPIIQDRSGVWKAIIYERLGPDSSDNVTLTEN